MPLGALFRMPTIEGLVDAISGLGGEREVVEDIARTWQELEKLSQDEVEAILKQN